MRKVFDSSAVLAFLYAEPGGDALRSGLPDGVMTAVNAAEVLSVLVRDGIPMDDARLALESTGVEILDFTARHAVKTAELASPQARSRGISLGDRACMAAAILMDAPAVTADRAWTAIRAPGLKVETIRG
jgi:PIN domain nuclease of toxin-antitoxin system